MSQEFWNKEWAKFKPYPVTRPVLEKESNIPGRYYLNLISSNIKGKTVLDIGCGIGLNAVYLAKLGARVTAVDNSKEAIEHTLALAKFNHIEASVKGFCYDALDLDKKLKNKFDLVIGKFILHHIEPFEKFPPVLDKLLSKNGRAVFYENNSRNLILMWFRKYLSGKFGVAKYGDDTEQPLSLKKIKMLEKKFNSVEIHSPEFIFFNKINPYIFKNKNRLFANILPKLDQLVYVLLPFLRKYTYEQIIEIKK